MNRNVSKPETLRRLAAFPGGCIVWMLLIAAAIVLWPWFPLALPPVHADGPLDQVGWVSSDTQSTFGVAWGDMDGDGDLDLAIGNGGYEAAQVNQVYRNDGQGVFSSFDLGTDTTATYGVAWGDMDGDGDLDLAVANDGTNQVYRNDGGGTFSPFDLGSDTKVTYGVAWGDYDGDGDLDLAVANSGVNQVYQNDGEGMFSPFDLGTDSEYSTSVAWGDYDSDGDLDLAIGNSGVNQVYRNDGEGVFSPFDLSTDSKYTISVAWGDMDGDGDLDLAVGNWDQVNQVYRNDGGGTFSFFDLSTDSTRTYSVAWGDCDGDGDLDLAVGNRGQVNQVHRNDGEGIFSLFDLGTDTKSTGSVAWGDVDGDGDLDLAVGNGGHSGEANQVYYNDGEGPFSSFDLGIDAQVTESVVWGDYDGDGDLDLAVGNLGWPVGQVNQVYRNDGEGAFSPFDLDTDAEYTMSVAWGDMDGDGDLDLAVGNIGQVNRLYENVGGDTFVEIADALGSAADKTVSVVWGDYDGDGDLDLAVGNFEEVNQVYRNDGGETFSSFDLGTGTERTYSVAWGDYDGDGDLDLAVGNDDQVNQVYRNDGEGIFSLFDLGADTKRTASVAWGDYDGDGDLDLAVGNIGQVNQVYRNDGEDAFSLFDLGTDTKNTMSVAWGDCDGDGDLDLAVGNYGEVNQVYRNDGQRFSPFDLGTNAKYTRSVAWGDTDGDGDLDLAVGNDGYYDPGYTYYVGQVNQVYENTRQGGVALPNNAPALGFAGPYTSTADFYAAAIVLDSLTIPITYTLYDPEGDLVGGIAATYSPDGGGRWLPAVPTSNTVMSNLTTGRQVRLSRAYSPAQAIPDGTGGALAATLATTETYEIADLDVWLSVTHTQNADLGAVLVSPNGITVSLFNSGVLTGSGLFGTIFGDQAAVPVISGTAPYTRTYRPAGSLAGLNGETISGTWTLWITDTLTNGYTGTLVTWGLRIKTPAVTHVYTWDTSASGFFGQSDNVVLRLVAYPQPSMPAITGTYRYTNRVPGPFQWPYVSATTFPFRVRGTQVRVYSETVHISNTVASAMVCRLPRGQSAGGVPLADGSGVPFRTDHLGYLQGRGQLAISDTLFAMAPVHSAQNYEGALEFDGVDDYAIAPSALASAPVTETTVSFWMRPEGAEDASGGGTPFSYAVSGEDDELTIASGSDLPLYRSGISVTTGITVPDGEWHHIAVTWRDTDDRAELYKDGLLAYSGTLTATQMVTRGSVVLGQDQDSVGGGFDPAQAFQGFLDEVRVWNVARTQAQILDEMYGFVADGEPGLVLYWDFNDPDIATSGLCADRSPNGNDGTLEGATWEGAYLGGYTVYHTSGAPTTVGVDAFTVSEPGVQVLTVTKDHPLILFDLDVSLEWDASSDPTYLDKLAFDLKKASAYLYDFTDGQVALGDVVVYQNGDNWGTSHVVVQATNRLRPFAAIGGIALAPEEETDPVDPEHPLEYGPGQVRLGATWNRYGTPGQDLGTDWPLALAHELGHYLLYQFDVYLGLNEEELLVPMDTCVGSAMGDVYAPDNTELVFESTHWISNCQGTLADHFLGRDEWETAETHYPWLVTPAATNTGPARMPFDFTTVTVVSATTAMDPLVDPLFYLDYVDGAVSSSEARAYLLRDADDAASPGADDYEYVYDLGSPSGGQNRVLARGARPGDRLCVFDRAQAQYGCEVITDDGDDRLQMEKDASWTPVIQISPVNSTTFGIRVSGLSALTYTLKARVYPEYGRVFSETALSYAGGVYSGTLSLGYPSLMGHVQVWVSETASEEDPRRETIVGYAVGGNPAAARGFGGGAAARGFGGGAAARGFGGGAAARGFGGGAAARGFGGGAAARGFGGGGSVLAGEAPLVSLDGQMILFMTHEITFAEGEFYTIQNMAGLPGLPDGKKAIGQGYNLFATPGTPVLTGSVNLQYMGVDVLVEGVDEEELSVHYWRDGRWRALETERSTYYNMLSARSEGEGVYAVLGGVTTPVIADVIPSAATNDVTTTLTIGGGYYLWPVEVVLVGPTGRYTLPVGYESVGPEEIEVVVPAGLPAREYEVVVVNRNEPGGGAVSPVPGAFALYAPEEACFYDFFESGASKWERSGEWGIAILPTGERAMTDSPTGNYDSAIPPATTYTTYITSTAFNLDTLVCANPALTFRHDYVIAQGTTHRDVGRVEISTDGGATWTVLKSYSGGEIWGVGAQDIASPEWTDVSWEDVQIDLSAYSGEVRLRFALQVDRYGSDKGWVIDNVVVKSRVGPSSYDVYLPVVLRAR